MEKKKESDIIDLRLVFRSIWARKMLFVKVLPIVFVLSCLYIICIPRTYTTSCKLAPEVNNVTGGGALGSLASNLGIDFTQIETGDAITPMLYPDLMEDNKFVVDLFKVKVKKLDGSVETTYDEYLRHHQESPWWAGGIRWFKSLFKSEKKEEGLGTGMVEPSPYILSKDDDDLANAIRGNIQFGIDKTTGVITINVTDQDPLVCKTIADSVSIHLQQFITEYRTNKARTDLKFYEKLTHDAKVEYDSVRRKYNALVDANQNVILQRYKSKQDDIENEMVLKFNTYTSLNTLLQQSISKVQERTPVFSVLKGAEMPLKPSGPKRMLFVLGMLMLASFVVVCWIMRKDFHF